MYGSLYRSLAVWCRFFSLSALARARAASYCFADGTHNTNRLTLNAAVAKDDCRGKTQRKLLTVFTKTKILFHTVSAVS